MTIVVLSANFTIEQLEMVLASSSSGADGPQAFSVNELSARVGGSNRASEENDVAEWPRIVYLKHEGSQRVSKFSGECTASIQVYVEGLLVPFDFSENVSEAEGRRRHGAILRYLCFCGGNLAKVQVPFSAKCYVKALRALSKQAPNGYLPLNASTFNNEMIALRGAISVLQSHDGSQDFRLWNATHEALKRGTNGTRTAASKAASITRTARFNSLPSLAEAIAELDESASEEFVATRLKDSTSTDSSEPWNIAVGAVVAHLFARCNFARPEALQGKGCIWATSPAGAQHLEGRAELRVPDLGRHASAHERAKGISCRTPSRSAASRGTRRARGPPILDATPSHMKVHNCLESKPKSVCSISRNVPNSGSPILDATAGPPTG